jgi:hypothetical protein
MGFSVCESWKSEPEIEEPQWGWSTKKSHFLHASVLRPDFWGHDLAMSAIDAVDGSSTGT